MVEIRSRHHRRRPTLDALTPERAGPRKRARLRPHASVRGDARGRECRSCSRGGRSRLLTKTGTKRKPTKLMLKIAPAADAVLGAFSCPASGQVRRRTKGGTHAPQPRARNWRSHAHGHRSVPGTCGMEPVPGKIARTLGRAGSRGA